MNFHEWRIPQVARPALLGYLPKSEGRDRLEALQAMLELGCSRVFEETGDELQMAIDSLGPGDTLVVPGLDALGIALTGLIALLAELSSKGIHFRTVREGIDTREAIRPGDLCRHLLQAQDTARRKKIKAGMSEAKRRGEGVGRPSVLRREDLLAFRQLLVTPGMTVRKAADSLGINVSTVRKRARALGISLRGQNDGASLYGPAPAPAPEDRSVAEAGSGKASRRPGRPRALRPKDVVAFCQLVEASRLSVKQAAAELGLSEPALRRWARDLGISLRRRIYEVKPAHVRRAFDDGAAAMPAPPGSGRRRRPRKLLAEEVAAFRHMVEVSGQSVSQAAMALGVCESTLRKYARTLGIVLPGRLKAARAQLAA